VPVAALNWLRQWLEQAAKAKPLRQRGAWDIGSYIGRAAAQEGRGAAFASTAHAPK